MPPPRTHALAAAALLALLPVTPVRGEDPPPAPPPAPASAAPPAAAKAPPADEGLPEERDVLREARSDPRNMRRDAFPVIRDPEYTPAIAAPRMDPDEWVIGAVIEGTPVAWPINILNQHEIVLTTIGKTPTLVCW